jgi:hypothetical protein
MSPDFLGLLQTIFISIFTGIISGLYTGLIVTRYTRFSDLRNESLRIIRKIDYVEERDVTIVTNDKDIRNLSFIGSELIFLSHKEAGNEILGLHKEISSSIYEARIGMISSKEFNDKCIMWQKAAMKISPNKIVLWSLYPVKL